MKRFFASYKLLVILSVIVTALTAQLIVTDTAIEGVDQAAADLNTRLKGLKISESEKLLRNLRRELDRKQLPAFTDTEARKWLIEVLDEFQTLYSAKISKPLTRDGSGYLAEISFKYLPDNPEDLIKLLKYMKTSSTPIYSVKRVRFLIEKGARVVEVNAEIIQPYKGEKYEY